MKMIDNLYFKALAKTTFFIQVAITSTYGDYLLMKQITMSETYAIACAIGWATLMVMVYSYFQALKENTINQLETSLETLKMIKSDPIVRQEPPVAKKQIKKIEIQHSVANSSPLPEFLNRDAK